MNDASAVGLLIGGLLGRNYAAKKQQGEVNKGLDYIKGLEEQNKTAGLLSQDLAAEQTWYNTNNQYLGIKKEWDDLSAAGQLTPEKQQELIARSHAARNAAQGLGITLPGEDVDANGMRLAMDAEGRTRMAGLGSRFANAGYAGAAQFMPQSDLGRDAGASQPQAFNFNDSMSGLGGMVNETRGLFADPNALRLKMLTDITKMNLSPAAMERISPVVESTLNTGKQETLRSLYTQLAQVGSDREAARPILIELAQNGVNVPAHLLPDKPDWRFSTAPDGSLIRADGNTGQAAVIGNFAKPEADWLTGFAPDGTPYKVNRKTGEVVYGQKGQYAKPPNTTGKNSNLDAAKVALSAYDKAIKTWSSNPENIGKSIDQYPYYQNYKTLLDHVTAQSGIGVGQQPQSGGNGAIDYYSAMNEITAALKRNSTAPAGQRWNRQQFESYIRQNGGDLADQLIADVDWGMFGLGNGTPAINSAPAPVTPAPAIPQPQEEYDPETGYRVGSLLDNLKKRGNFGLVRYGENGKLAR